MCGYRYDPDLNLSCHACPLHRGCQMVCCPSCGYQTVDTDQSWLVRVFERLLFTRDKLTQKEE
jgi:hypothetical protein